MVKANVCWTIVVLLGLAAAAQESKSEFEVASVKQSPDPTTLPVMVPDSGTLHPGGRWSAAFATLRNLIRVAHPGHDFADQIVGGPNWLGTDRRPFALRGDIDTGSHNHRLRSDAVDCRRSEGRRCRHSDRATGWTSSCRPDGSERRV